MPILPSKVSSSAAAVFFDLDRSVDQRSEDPNLFRESKGCEMLVRVSMNDLPCTSMNLGKDSRQVTTVARLISASSQKPAQAVL